ncbi:serine hydrolase [Sphingomonas sp.]|uniref:serine hydrolase n=1 Tax=Sphingomonas sp. TaxID=28214 RepID=UPI0025E9C8F8|nr:serine hydrolase [Sphingomonas sp.]
MTVSKRFAELRAQLASQPWPELRPLIVQPFTKLERALTLAGIAPALLVGAAVHDPSHVAFPLPGSAQAAEEVAAPVPPLPSAPPPASLVAELDALTARFGGTVGIAVTSLDDNWIAGHNGSLKLPQQSVSKLWVTMTVLDQVDQGKIRLTDPITITKADFTLFHQPVASLVKDDSGYTASVGEIVRRAMQMSDNTCNDKLLRLVGGPQAVRAFIARKGLGAIRFGPGEKLLQAATAGLSWKPEYSMGNSFAVARSKLPAAVRLAAFDAYVGDPPDGAAPEAIAMALSRLKKGELLSPESTKWLIDTMAGARTGRARVHAAVPPGWDYAHKTGTGQDLGGRTAGFNDVGILTAPDGKTYALAIMIGDYAGPIQNRQLLMQAVAKAVVATHP